MFGFPGFCMFRSRFLLKSDKSFLYKHVKTNCPNFSLDTYLSICSARPSADGCPDPDHKAEDARRYDAVLENLMKSSTADVRKRAALAAGRIGKEESIPT